MAFRKLCVCSSLISTAKMSEKKREEAHSYFPNSDSEKKYDDTCDLYLAQKEKRDKEITKVA